MKFYFYSKLDQTQEAINSITCSNVEEAVNFFIKVKKLSRKNFLEIYNIGISLK